VSSDPAEGSSVAKGTTVTVFTSDGQGVSVPDVSSSKSMSFGDAQSQLQSAGFTDISQTCQEQGQPTDPANNRVIAQDPGAGVITSKAQKITLTVQKFKC
jgi:beta-lactam-binding protein with PASTA domain